MEMNTRIQVEHPVTEMVTGIDIVKEQILIADGKKLSFSQSDVVLKGHSIECRINAENPAAGFIPSPGKIEFLNLPSGGYGLRVDSAAFTACEIPPFYDSMLAKVITHGADRKEAIQKMRRALSEFVVSGIETNIDFQLELIESEEFGRGSLNTGFINSWIDRKTRESAFRDS